MDLQQTVQDLAEAWVAASTDTSFRRTQLQVYGSGSPEEDEEEGDLSIADDVDIDVDPTITPSSPPHAVITGGDGSGPSHSRKRKQSTPQQRREGLESERSGASPATATSPALKGSTPLMKKAKHEEGKMLPVHCVVEILDTHPTSQKKGEKDDDGDEEGKKEAGSKKKEGYAIVPATLQLRDLVRVALAKLDYTPEKAKNATGVIQVRNWKALPFSAITDNVQSSVGQLFGDLLSHITLKITILSSSTGMRREWTDQAVRCTVMELLKHYNQSRLAQICPLSQSMISYIANSKYKAAISNEKIEEFGRWYQNFTLHKFMKPTETSSPTNIKVKFDPAREIPLLRDWYAESQHPPDTTYERYRDTINALPSRTSGQRRPVEVSHLKTWWKNERARLRKTGSTIVDASTVSSTTPSSTTPARVTMPTPTDLPGSSLVIDDVPFVPPPRPGRGKFAPAFFSQMEDQRLVVQEQRIATTMERVMPDDDDENDDDDDDDDGVDTEVEEYDESDEGKMDEEEEDED